jgi:quercetin dioxygenase-like cupin family protein
MNATRDAHSEEHFDRVWRYVFRALAPREIAPAEAEIAACAECRREVELLRRVARSFAAPDGDGFRPADSLWGRLAGRIAGETGAPPFTPRQESWAEPEWEEAAPGIHVKILAANSQSESVSMLVRLDPGTDYPGHKHAGVEELHLLQGVLKVDDKTYYPGDFLRSEPGSVDHRVWSETGCTCFLMTSTKDLLF